MTTGDEADTTSCCCIVISNPPSFITLQLPEQGCPDTYGCKALCNVG